MKNVFAVFALTAGCFLCLPSLAQEVSYQAKVESWGYAHNAQNETTNADTTRAVIEGRGSGLGSGVHNGSPNGN